MSMTAGDVFLWEWLAVKWWWRTEFGMLIGHHHARMSRTLDGEIVSTFIIFDENTIEKGAKDEDQHNEKSCLLS
jgi:hypothetical protein